MIWLISILIGMIIIMIWIADKYLYIYIFRVYKCYFSTHPHTHTRTPTITDSHWINDCTMPAYYNLKLNIYIYPYIGVYYTFYMCTVCKFPNAFEILYMYDVRTSFTCKTDVCICK